MENECSSDDCINNTNLEFLDVIPAHIDLVGIEIELVEEKNREYKLKEMIKGFMLSIISKIRLEKTIIVNDIQLDNLFKKGEL